jgi:transposase
MSYSGLHETSDLCSGTLKGGARGPGDRAALQRRFRPAPLPNLVSQRPRAVPAQDKMAKSLGCGSQTLRNAIHAFNERGLGALVAGSSRPKRTHAAFEEEGAEALKELLHHSPREFGKETSLWTLEDAAEVSFEERLSERRVSGETIRATLLRLGVRWERAKRWISSPDPEYARKKGLGTG